MKKVIIKSILIIIISILMQNIYSDNKIQESNALGFVEEAILTDINTATYYELLDWIRKLELSEKGNKAELKNRLLDYYGVKEKSTKTKSSEKRTVTIESAEKTEYFTVEKINENYIRIIGKVKIVLDDKKNKKIHKITADKIIFNESKNLINAIGNVNYIITENEKDELFEGEYLNFNLDSFEGLFLDGVSSKERNYKDKDEVEQTDIFYFSGKTMKRSKDDVITLNKGVMASSKYDDPYFSVRAKKIWVFAPGEWGFDNGVIYVGRIPVFYMPFFFKTGDEPVFHPSFGYKNNEGSFINTTTYFFGRREKDADSLSFLQFTDEGSYDEELKGLYLRKKKKENPTELNDLSYLKFMADAYSNLGYMTGLESKVENKSIIKKLEFYTSIARSRNVYINNETTSPYYNQEDDWNEPYFLGSHIPFRYSMDLNFNISSSVFNNETNIEIYSDPFIIRDFENRAEKIDWGNIIFGEEVEDLKDEGTTISSFIWYSKSSFNMNLSEKYSIINNISINRLNFEVQWQQGGDSNAGVASGFHTKYYDPEGKFFYPVKWTFPDFSAAISGVLLETNADVSDKNIIEDDIIFSFPEDSRTENNNEYISENDIKKPIHIENEKVLNIPGNGKSTNIISYKIDSSISIQNITQYKEWGNPEDVSYETAYSILNQDYGIDLKYSGKYFDSSVIVDNTISADIAFKNYFNEDEEYNSANNATIWKDEYASTPLQFYNDFDFKYYLFKYNNLFNGTYFEYKINTIIFKKEYEGLDDVNEDILYHSSFTKLNSKYITENSAALYVNIKPDYNIHTYSIKSDLPPQPIDVYQVLTLNNYPFTTMAAYQVHEVDKEGQSDISAEYRDREWFFGPVILSEKYNFSEKSYILQSLTYNMDDDNQSDMIETEWIDMQTDIKFSFFEDLITLSESFSCDVYKNNYEKSEAKSSVTSLSFWDLTVYYEAKETYDYSFIFGNGWVKEDEEDFIPYKLKFNLNNILDPDPLWKNRIDIKSTFNTTWETNLVTYTDSVLTLEYSLDLEIYKFLDLNLSMSSENKRMYSYIPGQSEKVDQEGRNVFEDLFKSFNFFNTEDRKESYFNFKEISISAVHHLEDWDLEFEYSGSYEADTSTGRKMYKWTPSFSIFVTWKPIPQVKSDIKYDENNINF